MFVLFNFKKTIGKEFLAHCSAVARIYLSEQIQGP